jgi:hypothetical protein
MKRSFALALAAFTLAAGLSCPALAQTSDQLTAAPKKKQLAPQPSVSSLEIAGTFGPTVVFGEAANPEYVQTFSRTGAYGELALAYRSSYFVDPFVSVGYGTLASGESRIPAGPYGAGGNVGQHLGAWVISPGITSDIWRFRPRLGLGLAIVQQTFEFRGETHSSSQTPLATQLGLGFNAFDDDRFRLDLEARAILISGADVNFMTLDVVLRGDLLYFVRR